MRSLFAPMLGPLRTDDDRLRATIAYAKNNPHSSVYRDVLSDVDIEGLTKETLRTIRPTSVDGLRAHSESLLHVSELESRYLVSQFGDDEAEDLFLVGSRIDHAWPTLNEYVKAHMPKGAVIAVSRNWQLGGSFYDVCRAHEVPCTVFSPRDAAYIARLVEEVGIDMVVTVPDVAEEASQQLKERGLEKSVRTWIVLVELGASVPSTDLCGTVVFEHHLFPGVPLGVSQDGKSIRVSREYLVEVSSEGIYITSLEEHAVPFIRLFIPGHAHVLRERGGTRVVFLRSTKG